MQDRVPETRLSDGLSKVRPGEVDTMIAAGMGGNLIIRILSEGRSVVDTLSSCILQPQSEPEKVINRYVTMVSPHICNRGALCHKTCNCIEWGISFRMTMYRCLQRQQRRPY